MPAKQKDLKNNKKLFFIFCFSEGLKIVDCRNALWYITGFTGLACM